MDKIDMMEWVEMQLFQLSHCVELGPFSYYAFLSLEIDIVRIPDLGSISNGFSIKRILYLIYFFEVFKVL